MIIECLEKAVLCFAVVCLIVKSFLYFFRDFDKGMREKAYLQGFKDGLKGNKDISGNNFDDFGYDYVDGYKEGYKLKGSSYLKIQKQKKQKNLKKKAVLIEHN